MARKKNLLQRNLEIQTTEGAQLLCLGWGNNRKMKRKINGECQTGQSKLHVVVALTL